MTKEQAISEMQKGNKITHELFLDYEYLHMENGIVKTEDGVEVGEEFWNLRTTRSWAGKWCLYSPQTFQENQ